MNNLYQYILEKLHERDKGIMTMLEFYAKNMSGYQQKLYKDKLKDAESVDIVSIYDVFDKKTIGEIKK